MSDKYHVFRIRNRKSVTQTPCISYLDYYNSKSFSMPVQKACYSMVHACAAAIGFDWVNISLQNCTLLYSHIAYMWHRGEHCWSCLGQHPDSEVLQFFTICHPCKKTDQHWRPAPHRCTKLEDAIQEQHVTFIKDKLSFSSFDSMCENVPKKKKSRLEKTDYHYFQWFA